jgi:subtilisin family serine protease
MKIRFLQETNIRSAPSPDDGLRIGVMLEGAEIEVEPITVQGEAIEGNDRWYRDRNGWHYWSGRTAIVEAPRREEIEPEPPAPPDSETRRQDIPILPVFEDAMPAGARIPAGETRLAPPLEDLLLMEEGYQAGVIAAADLIPRAPAAPAADPVVLARPRGMAPAEPDPLREMAPPAPPVEAPPPPSPSMWTAEASISPSPPATAVPPPPAPQPAAPALWQAPSPDKLNWGLKAHHIPRDWWQVRGLSGKGVKIALLSTGVMPAHPDLAGRVEGFQYSDAAIPLQDTHGLGTQAAVVCAGGGQKVFGLAPGARVLAAKLGEQDHAIMPEGLLAGLDWAIGEQADIVAMLVDFPSLAAPQLEKLQALIERAREQHILLIAPVGTSEGKKPESRYPACLDGVLAVGAHNQDGQRSSFSARSYHLDILAPGEGLLTSNAKQEVGKNSKSTAIAAAYTAGFAALVCQGLRERQREFSPIGFVAWLRETAAARRDFNKGEDVEYGYGLLDPGALLQKLEE